MLQMVQIIHLFIPGFIFIMVYVHFMVLLIMQYHRLKNMRTFMTLKMVTLSVIHMKRKNI